MEIIKHCLQITDTDSLSTMVDEALEKYETKIEQFTKNTIMDLLRPLIPYINLSHFSDLYTKTPSGMISRDQKE